jgi:acyl transferase domain-containing protein/acyl carrier protein
MQQMPAGAMLGVSLPEKELKLLLTDDLSLAAVNGPSLCVVSGPHEAVRSLEMQLKKKGHKTRHLHTSHAFHSRMMEPLLKEFAEEIGRVPLSKPQIPYISNVTGKWITVEDAADPRYWARQVRETVRFAAGLEVLFEETGSIFVEVGPGTTLSTFTRQYLAKHPGHPVLNLVRHPKEKVSDLRYLLNILGQLWLYGKTIDWREFYWKEKRNRAPLPTYSFDRQRYPVDVSAFKAKLANISAQTFQEKKKNTDIADWFYIPLWMKAPLPIAPLEKIPPPVNWLVFVNEEGLGSKLVKRLEEAGQNVSIVRIGAEFKKYSEGNFAINPRHDKDYDLLLTELRKSRQVPNNILHLWSVSKNRPPTSPMEPIDSFLDPGFYSLLHTAQALGREGISGDIHIKVVSNNMQEVTGDENLQPEKAVLLGAVKVIPLEYPNLHCSSLDIVLPEPGSPSEDKLILRLLTECTSVPSHQVAAFRGNHRWVRIYKPFPFDKPGEVPQRLREKGVYLITGGLGGIGFTLAEYLAKHVKARLILTGRSEFPLKEGWDDWLRNHHQEDAVSSKIRKIRELEALGAEVLVISVNVNEHEKMRREIANAEKRFGPINGVIHSAGIADGAIIQGRTRRMSQQVFESKVKGTLVLGQIFKDKKLDFFVLCSSIGSVIPAWGQVAYSAANAYLDAFALYQNSIDENRFTTAVNWDTWQEVGMAVEAAKQLEKQFKAMRTKTGEIPHPLFDKFITEDSLDIYISHLSVKKNWVLDEHRIMGRAALPGTAYVEMARAVFENSVKKGPVRIRDLYFLQPLVVEDEEEIELRILLKKHKNHEQGFEFFVISRLREDKDEWREHARGNIGSLEDELPRQYELDEIESLCNEPAREIANPGKDPLNQEKSLTFGPRWDVSRQVKLGENRGLVKLELPGEFTGDLESYKLHPALFDTALAGAFTGGSYFLPFSYKSIKIYGALQPRVVSYIKTLDNNKKQKEFKNYQVAIMDEKGKALVDIEQYTLKEVPGEIIQSRDIGSGATAGLSLSNYIEPGLLLPGNSPGNLSNKASTGYGLLPSQGVEVFERILASSQPNVVISIQDFDERLKEAEKANILDAGAVSDRRDLPVPKYARPELSTKYIKPENETEKKIAEVFQKILGIDQIGVNDNFFELGANSLMLVTVNSQLKKAFTQDISVVDIYAYPTIKSLKEYLNQQEMSMDISREETEMLKKKKEKGKDKLKQRKQRRKRILNE